MYVGKYTKRRIPTVFDKCWFDAQQSLSSVIAYNTRKCNICILYDYRIIYVVCVRGLATNNCITTNYNDNYQIRTCDTA